MIRLFALVDCFVILLRLKVRKTRAPTSHREREHLVISSTSLRGLCEENNSLSLGSSGCFDVATIRGQKCGHGFATPAATFVQAAKTEVSVRLDSPFQKVSSDGAQLHPNTTN